MSKMAANTLLSIAFLAMVLSLASASDPCPLQDFCVAFNDTKEAGMYSVFVNGKFCKDPELATADDFFFSGLNVPGNTSNQLGSNVTLVNVDKQAGLNTPGISIARLDFAPYDLNPPHMHPRATELLTILEGTLYVGFIMSNPSNSLVTKILCAGDKEAHGHLLLDRDWVWTHGCSELSPVPTLLVPQWSFTHDESRNDVMAVSIYSTDSSTEKSKNRSSLQFFPQGFEKERFQKM
ncbi:germin-like protein subfamily 1 member 16 [Malania oleifera]|uniref:germin-like protein subfamily 1 member 16 n=1 Tax=Malania oleifera TaxID=397392 RepID=UPI0025AE1FF5|nr:germin-like protein subfamily 1 member 16 [Malania oleifera]